uniref:C3H1-type domain-containing protein n=1 Tax=Kalanchoe fedtschenkoi TaxID=63787 RepID=A0A7N0TDL5_KALFE
MAENDVKYPTDTKDVRSKYEVATSVREHASGNRGTWRDNSLDRGNRGFSEAGTDWDEDGGRRDFVRSPRSSWKRPLRSTSRGRSRSRSRSPIRAYRLESGVDARPRSKAEVPIQTCRDFTSGRCRRGSNCPFLHSSTHNYEDRRYDFEHREESVRGGKYSQFNASDGCYNDYNKETSEPKREYDRNSRGTSFNHGGDRDPRRSADIPCTFFAAGNCRNGKSCRFSHHISSSSSSGGRTHDGRWRTNHSPEKAGQMDRGTKFSDHVDTHTDYGKEGRSRTNRSPDRVDQGVKSSETADPNLVEYGKESHGKVVSPQPRSISSSMNSRWGNNIETSYVPPGGPTIMDKVVEVEANQSSQWKTENPGSLTRASEMKGVDNWIGDKMSPEWNPKVSSVRTVAVEEPAYAIQTSESVNHNVPPQASQLTHYVSSVTPDVLEKPNFQQGFNSINDAPTALSYDRNTGSNVVMNFNSSFLSSNSAQPGSHSGPNEAPGNLNALGQGQFSLTTSHPGNENASAIRNSTANYDMYSITSNCEDPKVSEAISGATPASNMVSQAQLAQLTDLSASLAHLLGKGQQLPQFYAALNPPNPVASLEISNGIVSQFPVESVLPHPHIGSDKPYGPVCDNALQIQPNISTMPTQYPLNPGVVRTMEDVKQEVPSRELNAGEAYKNGHAEGNLSQKPDTDSKSNKKPKSMLDESSKGKDKHAKPREGSPLENMDGVGKGDGGKKVKDTKALRDFKHGLVNFVKELLKPAWKDGQIDKEGFKTIVKKVTDKVTATIQEANIPQTPEKAYVDRHHKKQT